MNSLDEMMKEVKAMPKSDFVILGPAEIAAKDYLSLVKSVKKDFGEDSIVFSPVDTANFIKKYKENPNFLFGYATRAFGSVDKAKSIIFVLSGKSTGAGMEVDYLVRNLKKTHKNIICISENGKDPCPHFLGLYEIMIGEKMPYTIFENNSNMYDAVKKNPIYKDVLKKFKANKK